MTREEVKHDLQALIEYYNEEYGAVPMCLEYCLNMLDQEKGENHE